MKDRVEIITRWILYALLFIGAVAGVFFFTGVLGPIKGSGQGSSNLIYLGNFFLYLSVVVLIIAPIYTMINNPKNLGKMVASVVALLVVLAISYGVAGNSFSATYLASSHITAEDSRLVGMGLYASYIALALAVVAILYSALIKIFK